MPEYFEQYLSMCMSNIAKIRDKSGEAIVAAAVAVADSIQHDKGYFLFGSGHSALVAHEAYWRSGGLAPALPIRDPMEGDAERLSGYAPILLARYPLQTGGTIVVVSNSGVNPLPIEVASISRDRGLTVIAITCLSHSKNTPSRHPTSKKLYEVSDIVIDTMGEIGDAILEIPGSPGKIGPISTLAGIAIVDSISVQAVAILIERGITPPVLVSANLPAGDAHNLEIADRYREKLIRYEVPGVDAT
ncbi:MAG: sugar isomerase domain-containing protein [Anaerolineaceae bacterium]|nr:sugar isomerase domain-containing protein [Anaerolineaceae bacterium]